MQESTSEKPFSSTHELHETDHLVDHPLIIGFYVASFDNPIKDKGTNYSNILPKDGRKLIFDMSPVLIRGGKAIKEYSYAEHTSVMEPGQSAQMILSGEPESENSVDCGQSSY